MSDHGFISLGKFSSARDSILHYMSDGWGNDSSGSVDAPTGYFVRISNDWEEVKPENGEFSSMLEEWFEQNPEVTDSPELRRELVGHFLVREDSNGFVTITEYPTKGALQSDFDKLDSDWVDWDMQDED